LTARLLRRSVFSHLLCAMNDRSDTMDMDGDATTVRRRIFLRALEISRSIHYSLHIVTLDGTAQVVTVADRHVLRRCSKLSCQIAGRRGARCMLDVV